ncbi:MAG: hypothetical protein Q8O61_12775 [Nocardioides sp.]|nr:hypothetical protein [Nocardioides sp.]
MKTLTSALSLPTALAIGLLCAPALASDAPDRAYEPPPKTIIKVEGDKANGFGIYYYDGTSIFPPTDSESYAECGEYDRYVDRVRCRTEVRVWYRELGNLKRSIKYARKHL